MPIIALVPAPVARAIIDAAEIEGCSVSRVVSETLAAVFLPEKKRR